MGDRTNSPSTGSTIDPVKVFWNGLDKHVLLVQRCETCGATRWPPSPVCDGCLGEDFQLTELAPRGRLITWCTYHRAFSPEFEGSTPYVVALVELDSGPQLITRLVGDTSSVQVSDPVEGRFIKSRSGSGHTLLYFSLADSGKEMSGG